MSQRAARATCVRRVATRRPKGTHPLLEDSLPREHLDDAHVLEQVGHDADPGVLQTAEGRCQVSTSTPTLYPDGSTVDLPRHDVRILASCRPRKVPGRHEHQLLNPEDSCATGMPPTTFAFGGQRKRDAASRHMTHTLASCSPAASAAAQHHVCTPLLPPPCDQAATPQVPLSCSAFQTMPVQSRHRNLPLDPTFAAIMLLLYPKCNCPFQVFKLSRCKVGTLPWTHAPLPPSSRCWPPGCAWRWRG